MPKTRQTTPAEEAGYQLAHHLDLLAREQCAEGDPYAVHWLITQCNSIRRLTSTLERRFGERAR